MGEEAMYSKSDHFDEEDASRESDNKCTPLINPWYNAYPHFPKVPGDYVMPSPGRVWLTMCRRNPNISWASVSSSISDLCATTHTFFFSCGELTVTLEDKANQLLLPILGDTDLATIELSSKEEAIEAELRKRMVGNAKLSYWVSSSSKFSVTAHRVAFVAFWLFKFVFGSHPHYAVKPLYFHLAIKIAAGVSLPLAPMFLGHLYVQLDILQSYES
nr:hypothetical protein CFP56_05934 [Quercus suber]